MVEGSGPDLQSQAFPKLDVAQIASLDACVAATRRRYSRGDALFRVGDRDFPFFVVRSGEIEIRVESGPTSHVIAVHGPGEFTGDVAHVTGRPSLVSGYARTDAEVYAISSSALRQILNQRPDLGDVILQAFLARRQLLRETPSFTGVQVIGSRYSRDTFRIRDFLARNRVLFRWFDLESDPEVHEVLRRFGVMEKETPVVAWGRSLLLRNPSNEDLADALGLRRPFDQKMYDLAVVGGGPAGLAAAVYGASEGLSTVVLERIAPGGQAATSARIENYLGFPTGITGAELADRAVLQASKFGAFLSVPTPVASMDFESGYANLRLEDGESISAKSVLIATGADYRRLEAEGCERFEGTGVYYAATPIEAQACRGRDVVVVGGGNSAGQAAVYLAGLAHRVFLVVRGDDLGKSMSSYLVERIRETPNIEVLTSTEVRAMRGDGQLAEVDLADTRTGRFRTLQIAALFSFIGAAPRTDWLPPEIERDEKRFVRTGPSLAQSLLWNAKRQPFLLETSRAGVFAAGDVRSGSVKRVASAVGEGAMAVQFVHEYFRTV